jgi:hypothetical protein
MDVPTEEFDDDSLASHTELMLESLYGTKIPKTENT